MRIIKASAKPNIQLILKDHKVTEEQLQKVKEEVESEDLTFNVQNTVVTFSSNKMADVVYFLDALTNSNEKDIIFHLRGAEISKMLSVSLNVSTEQSDKLMELCSINGCQFKVKQKGKQSTISIISDNTPELIDVLEDFYKTDKQSVIDVMATGVFQ